MPIPISISPTQPAANAIQATKNTGENSSGASEQPTAPPPTQASEETASSENPKLLRRLHMQLSVLKGSLGGLSELIERSAVSKSSTVDDSVFRDLPQRLKIADGTSEEDFSRTPAVDQPELSIVEDASNVESASEIASSANQDVTDAFNRFATAINVLFETPENGGFTGQRVEALRQEIEQAVMGDGSNRSLKIGEGIKIDFGSSEGPVVQFLQGPSGNERSPESDPQTYESLIGFESQGAMDRLYEVITNAEQQLTDIFSHAGGFTDVTA